MKQVAFGSYTLYHRLATGGMAELYLGHRTSLGRNQEPVVIKLLAPRFNRDEAFVSMFRDEARLAASLHHPHIGRVLDVGEVDGQSFIVMEFIHGQDLYTISRRADQLNTPLSAAFAVPVGIRVCAGLHYAHELRDAEGTPLEVIHRDVSLSNIMVTYGGQVKLVDFGIARASQRCSYTMPGMLKGKARYMSPEQITGEPLDRRSDLFTLAVSLWEITCGRHLFNQKNDVHVYEAVAKGWITPPSEVVPDYPPALEQILMRALSVAPGDRPSTAEELQRELETYAKGAGITVSDLTLSRFMHQLFKDEVKGWQESVAQRKTLLAHVIEQGTGQSHTHDLDHVFSASDHKETYLSRSAPLEPDRTVESGPPAAALSPDGPRYTIPMGMLDPPTEKTDRPPAPEPQAAGVIQGRGEHLRVSDQSPVAIGPDGHVLDEEQLRRGTSSGADHRPTIIAGSHVMTSAQQEDALERPTLVEPPTQGRSTMMIGSNTFSVDLHRVEAARAPQDASATPSSGTGAGASPKIVPPSAAEAKAIEPVVAADLEDLAVKQAAFRQRQQHGAAAFTSDPEEEGAENPLDRTRTGDWSHQATSKGEERAGTHPYFGFFREVALTFVPGGLDESDLELDFGQARRRRIARVVALATVALVALGVILWLTLGHGDAPKVASHTPSKGAPAAATSAGEDERVQLTSEPSGATVYDAADGHELGRTPLHVPLGDRETRKVLLRLEGYAMQTITLEQADRQRTVALRPDQSAESAAGAAAAQGDSPSAEPGSAAAPAAAKAGPDGVTRGSAAPRARPPRGRPAPRRAPHRRKVRDQEDSLINPFNE